MGSAFPEQKSAHQPEPMPQVLVVVRDEILREMLRITLEDVGYAVAACADGTFARKLLQIAHHPVVVVLVHGGPDQTWDEVLTAAPTLPAHAYLLLSSQPAERVPARWNPHTQAAVPVVTMPFATDTLVQHIADAVELLTSLASASVGVESAQDLNGKR